jgi:two-component system sensor kinase FixL
MIESERVRADAVREEALRLSAANFSTAFRSNPCAMTIVRLSDARFQDVNESFERQTGFHRDEVIGRTVAECGMWIDPDDLAEVSREMRAEGRIGSREVRFRTKGGAPATAICSANIIMLGGEPCVLAMGLDITDRRNAEIQVSTLREELAHVGRLTLLDVLTGSLAHEINQPLAAILANTEAALRLLDTRPLQLHELRETLNDIRRDNRRAGDVLLPARTFLRKGAPRYEPVDMNSMVSEVVKLVRSNTAERRITLDVDLTPGMDPVLGDRVQIQQVMINLLMNAFDAVQEREPADRRVLLRTSPREKAVTVDVRDRGQGLSDEALALIFEPFYTTKRNGMGLGLSICRAIMTAHGGMLEAVRNPDRGMTFSARFPTWRPAEPGPHHL